MNTVYCADLYDSAFLLVQGARLARVKEYYKNSKGRSFSILELNGITPKIAASLFNNDAEINFRKFKEKRKYLKKKLDAYQQKTPHKSISSKDIYKYHREFSKQIRDIAAQFKAKPKRVMYEDDRFTDNGEPN